MRFGNAFGGLRARAVGGIAALAAIGLAPATASATPLNLILQLPDVVSGLIDITYNAGTDVLSMSGVSLELDDDGSPPNIGLDVLGTFVIDAEIDSSGNLVLSPTNASNTITVTGEVGPYTSGTLITGDLTDFGWSGGSSGMVLEFTFDVTGGDLASVGGFGTFDEGGVIVGTGSNTFSSWASSWDNLFFGIPGTGSGTSDTAPIPEPSTALLLYGGIAALALRSRRS
jgi:hypothetical protein